ncbi:MULTISPECIES: ankyrin repeat domain-containing protein [unclassified Rhizobacter]|uniref:ankyrin repeat domain-containing protein n=1 Tax=unclassified Rhizobacter TaxID=2640088 RepID=UPI0009EBA01D|nr:MULTISPECIES: ankyrin repeat domain-containing protein [unclassified Rhizobacter]
MSIVLERLRQHWWALTDDDGLDIPLTTVNQVNILGERPIHIAAWKGEVADIQWLLENGADINARGEYGMTPLHYAYMGGRQENVSALLSAGVDKNLRCDRGLLASDGRPNIEISR